MHATCYKTLLAVISVLVVALVYSSFSAFYTSTFYAFAAPPEPGFISSTDCEHIWQEEGDVSLLKCCWTETDPSDPEGIEIHKCQVCTGEGSCTDWYPGRIVGTQGQPTPTPPVGKGLFGSNVLPTPSISPDDDGVVEQPPITTPTAPIAPPSPTEPPTIQTPPTIAPEDSQGDDQSGTDGGTGGGGVKPPVKDLLPDTGIREQPEVQQPEEEPPNEGQGPAGPLT